MTIEWQDRFNIGNQQIDHQHQQLFSIANHFLTATTQSDRLHCAENLFEYTRNHFSYEESLMKKFNFPELAEYMCDSQTRHVGIE